jgi:surface antigen
VSQPQPGDPHPLGTEHVGIVQSVNPDGTLTTVEGNASNAVSIEQHSPGDATGFVRL